MKTYAKKREPVRAVQWTGSMTPEMKELVGDHQAQIDSDHQLIFANTKGPGRFARVGDWMISTSGEDLSVMGDDTFRRTYEEVDEDGRSWPTADKHEAAGQEFVQELDALLVAGLKLSVDEHPKIFRGRDKLVHVLSRLLADHAWTAQQREKQRLKERINKEILT